MRPLPQPGTLEELVYNILKAKGPMTSGEVINELGFHRPKQREGIRSILQRLRERKAVVSEPIRYRVSDRV